MPEAVTSKCPICRRLRPLSEHLHELALANEYLENTAKVTRSGQERTVSTRGIAQWLRLASQLERVEINEWKFEHTAMYCEPAAARVDSDSEHYSRYSTELTRFVFVCNALEELYGFVDGHFVTELPQISRRVKAPSMRAALLADHVPERSLPLQFDHFTMRYAGAVEQCAKYFVRRLSGLADADAGRPGYALHMVRNVRNWLAHGELPIAHNPNYAWRDEGQSEALLRLLIASCRVAAFYIQMLLHRYNHGFRSRDYETQTAGDDASAQWFRQGCTLEYLRGLHLTSAFSLAQPYRPEDWEPEGSEDNN